MQGSAGGGAPWAAGRGGAGPGGPPNTDPQTQRGLSFEAYISVPSLEA